MSLLDHVAGPFYDAWECLPAEARAAAIRLRLDDYVRYARERVPFYRDRLSAYDAAAEHPLAGVPVLESAALRELLPPQSGALLARPDVPYNVFQSGGTTGHPKTTLFSHDELDGLTLPNARGFYALGLSREDRVCNLFAVGGLYMTFIHINRMLQEYGCMNFPFSNHTPVDFVHGVVRLFSINCIAGITSIALACLRGMADLGLDGIRIEKLFTGGEHIYEADARDVRERFGTRLIAAPGYGTVDTWYIGYQCLSCPLGVFHAHDDQTYTEIVNEETLAHCPPGEAGSLYATPFPRRLTPVVRYRVGDRASWIAQPCPCGRTTPRFRLLGRADDVLRIGFDSVDYAYVQEKVLAIRSLSGTVQMKKEREAGRDRLVVRVETAADPGEHAALAAALTAAIVEGRPSLRHFIHEGTVWPVRVEVLAPGALERNPRTGKLARVVDAL
jgi:phenylacetate-coenzyme A ligase PaaK-like adenylate-forming protein